MVDVALLVAGVEAAAVVVVVSTEAVAVAAVKARLTAHVEDDEEEDVDERNTREVNDNMTDFQLNQRADRGDRQTQESRIRILRL